MLQAQNLSIEYSKVLFKNISFTLGNKEKVGLVGHNGSGKSTLLKIIIGEELPSTGKIISTNEKLGYLPQLIDIDLGKFEFIGEFLESLVENIHTDMWMVNKILHKLEFGSFDEFEQVAIQSPGRKMKLYLTQILLAKPTILLLDEPTNHLDIAGIMWFEQFVKSFDGICIIISHDREFLNNTIDTVFEIDDQSLHLYKGNYDDFVAQRKERIDERHKQFKIQEQKRELFERRIEFIKRQSSSAKQGKRLRAMKKRFEREVLSQEVGSLRSNALNKFSLEGSVHKSKQILSIENLCFSYSKNKKIFNNCNFEMYGVQKVWLLGENGSGKTTLLKLLLNKLEAQSGTITWGADLKVEYFAQTHEELSIHKSVQEYFFEQTNSSWGQSFGLLSKFKFDNDLRSKRVLDLSPGQKARLRFAIFAQREYNCLILDEPTNHLDIETKEVIEQSLREFKGAIILVSHDRYFAQQLEPDRILTIEDGKLVEV